MNKLHRMEKVENDLAALEKRIANLELRLSFNPDKFSADIKEIIGRFHGATHDNAPESNEVPKDRKSQTLAEEETVDVKKCHTCIAYHIQAFQRQTAKGIPADMCEACEHCSYVENCDLRWYHYISQAIPKTKYQFTLLKGGAYLPDRNIDDPCNTGK